MADDPVSADGVPLPPKLDLRKEGVLKDQPEAKIPPQAPAPAHASASFPIKPIEAPSPTIDAKKNATMHIDLTEVKPQIEAARADRAGGTVPPSQTATPEVKPDAPAKPLMAQLGVKTPAFAAGGLPPRTVKMKRPAELSSPQPAATAPAGTADTTMRINVPEAGSGAKPDGFKPINKKDTSRIPLDSATATAPSDPPAGAPKTIRIKPTAAPASLKVGVPSPAPGSAMTDKSKTSRISLEAALASDADPAQSGSGPKTIRLKRPSEAATVKLTQKPKMAGAPGAKDPMDKTARLDDTEQMDEQAPTRKRTIKVKRPGAGGTSVAVPPAGGPAGPDVTGSEDEEAAAPVVTVPRHDEPGLVFAIFTIAAILVMGVAIYVFCAQALGPNLSLTQFSWRKDAPDLPWYGKVPMKR